MIDFDIGPRVAVVGALLQVERVVLVGLRRRAADQPVKDGRIAFDARTVGFRAFFFLMLNAKCER